MEELYDLIRHIQFLTGRYLGRDISNSDTESFYILEYVHTELVYSMRITEIPLVFFYELQHPLFADHLGYDLKDILFFRHSETREHFDIS